MIDCSLFVGHSSRTGEATVAAQRGTQNSLIKTMGEYGIFVLHQNPQEGTLWSRSYYDGAERRPEGGT